MNFNRNIPEYIVAICPQYEVVAQVAKLKELLYSAIGWFGSYRSEAHLTIHSFDADEEILDIYRRSLKEFVSKCNSHILKFSSFSYFNQGQTIFIAPEPDTEMWIDSLVRDYMELFYPNGHPPFKFKAHLTIGRAIKPQYFAKTKEVFADKEIGLSFICNNLALRKYNHERKQYDIVARYYFPQTS